MSKEMADVLQKYLEAISKSNSPVKNLYLVLWATWAKRYNKEEKEVKEDDGDDKDK